MNVYFKKKPIRFANLIGLWSKTTLACAVFRKRIPQILSNIKVFAEKKYFQLVGVRCG